MDFTVEFNLGELKPELTGTMAGLAIQDVTGHTSHAHMACTTILHIMYRAATGTAYRKLLEGIADNPRAFFGVVQRARTPDGALLPFAGAMIDDARPWWDAVTAGVRESLEFYNTVIAPMNPDPDDPVPPIPCVPCGPAACTLDCLTDRPDQEPKKVLCMSLSIAYHCEALKHPHDHVVT